VPVRRLVEIRSRLTYANVLATVALFIALGGASYAAVALPTNSVGTRQLAFPLGLSHGLVPALRPASRSAERVFHAHLLR
jgi:hypothetical protein